LRGNVAPSSFIPLAEECGLIGELSRWVLRTACARLAAWRLRGTHVPSIPVNLSPLTLHDADLPRLVQDTLLQQGLRPADLIIEITEGVMLDKHAATMQTIKALEDLGVRLSMDDFGTGYSSLSYLHRLPITELKIDRSFVSDLGFRDNVMPLLQGHRADRPQPGAHSRCGRGRNARPAHVVRPWLPGPARLTARKPLDDSALEAWALDLGQHRVFPLLSSQRV